MGTLREEEEDTEDSAMPHTEGPKTARLPWLSYHSADAVSCKGTVL